MLASFIEDLQTAIALKDKVIALHLSSIKPGSSLVALKALSEEGKCGSEEINRDRCELLMKRSIGMTYLSGDPYSSVGKRSSLAVRRSLVRIQQGVPLSSALSKIERCQGWVLSKSLEKFLLEVNLDNCLKKN